MRKPFENVVTVHRCVHVIGSTLASVPRFFHREGERVEDKASIRHWRERLLDEPNQAMDGDKFVQVIATTMLLIGEQYTHVDMVGPVSGVPLALFPQTPGSVTPYRPTPNPYDVKGWQMANRREPLKFREMVRFEYAPSIEDPYRAVSPLRAANLSVETEYLAALYHLGALKNSGTPAGILNWKGDPELLTDSVSNEARRRWKERNGGPENAEKVAVMGGHWEFQATGIPPKDMQWIEGRKFDNEHIARVYGVPPIFIGIYDGSGLSDAGVKTQERLLYRNAVVPLGNLIAKAITRSVIRPLDPTLSFAFDWDAVPALRDDFTEKLNHGKGLADLAYPLNVINERLALGMPVMPWGNEAFVDGGKITASAVVELSTLPPDEEPAAETKTPAAETTPAESETEGADSDTQSASIDATREAWRAEERSLRWRAYAEQAKPLERATLATVRRYLIEQRAAVLAALRKKRGATGLTRDDDGLDDPSDAADRIDSEALAKKLRANVLRTYREGGDGTVDQLEKLGVASDEVAKAFRDRELPKLAARYYDARISTLVDVGDLIRERVRGTLEEGYAAGEPLDKLMDRVRATFQASASRARVIARTEVHAALNGGRYEAMAAAAAGTLSDENSVALDEHEWLSADDDHMRDSHRAVDGTVVRIGEVFPQVGIRYPGDPSGEPGETINCVLPGTMVSGAFTGGLKARYSGEVVEISTRRGHRLSVTVNHPILTPGGFLPAGSLREGDYVISKSAGYDRGFSLRDNKHEQPEACIEDVFDAIRAKGALRVCSPSAFDLDGDGKFLGGKIEYVSGLGPLPHASPEARNTEMPHKRPAAGIEYVSKLGFVATVPAEESALATRVPGAQHRLARHASAAGGTVGSVNLTANSPLVTPQPSPLQGLSGRPAPRSNAIALQGENYRRPGYTEFSREAEDASSAHKAVNHGPIVGDATPQYCSLGTAANWDTPLPEEARQGLPLDPKFLSELLRRLSSEVSPDQIISIRKFEYSGHVYDLQTTVGYFLSGGVVNRNCRCTLVPRPRDS